MGWGKPVERDESRSGRGPEDRNRDSSRNPGQTKRTMGPRGIVIQVPTGIRVKSSERSGRSHRLRDWTRQAGQRRWRWTSRSARPGRGNGIGRSSASTPSPSTRPVGSRWDEPQGPQQMESPKTRASEGRAWGAPSTPPVRAAADGVLTWRTLVNGHRHTMAWSCRGCNAPWDIATEENSVTFFPPETPPLGSRPTAQGHGDGSIGHGKASCPRWRSIATVRQPGVDA
jgi:hypothetical protein